MQTPLREAETGYAFEFTHEVFEKIQNANDLHILIPEDNVRALEYVDVSGKIYCKVKRLLDIFISLFALIVLLIPMAFIALAIYIDDPGKIMFAQYRVGLHGKRFLANKFLTTPRAA
jgi:lipopolysaccharide/colanic/teichoic acid biosynthesis glycosyltransferase